MRYFRQQGEGYSDVLEIGRRGRATEKLKGGPLLQSFLLVIVLLFSSFAVAEPLQFFPLGQYYNEYPGVLITSYITASADTPYAYTEQFTNVPSGWFAVGLRPDVITDGIYGLLKRDLSLYSDNGEETNFLLKNFAVAPDRDDADFYFELYAQATGTEHDAWEREYMIEWDSQHNLLPLNYDVRGSFSAYNIIDVLPVTLAGGREYTFSLTVDTFEDSSVGAGAALKLYLIKDSGNWLSSGDAVFDLSLVCSTADSTSGIYDVNPGEGGDFVLVVINNSPSYEIFGDPHPQGDYVINVTDTAIIPDQPNLQISSVSVANPVVDSNISVGFYVTNVGDSDSAASTTRVTVDSTVTCNGVSASFLGFGESDYGRCVSSALAAGVHSVTVCADSGQVVDESDELDNCKSRTFTVLEASTPLPDLEITDANTSSGVEGQIVHLSAVVKNIGDAAAPSSLARVLVDNTIICDGTVSLAALDAGQLGFTDNCSVEGLLPGSHQVTFCVNTPSSFTESRTDNNCLSDEELVITPAPKADLVVEQMYPLDVNEDQEFTLSVLIRNKGQATAPESIGHFVENHQLGFNVSVPSIPAGGSHVLSVRYGEGLAAGVMPLSFSADYTNQVEESVEANNTLTVNVVIHPRTAVVYPDGHGLYPTIQAAVDAVSLNGIVQLVAGTYGGDGNRDIDFHGRTVNIRGAEGILSTIDCGADVDPHVGFILSGEGAQVSISNVRVTNGGNEFFGGAFIAVGLVKAVIEDCIFEDNVSNRGGAVDARSGADLVFRRCQFLNNRANAANYGGGAIHGDDATVSVYGSLFWRSKGGAVSVYNCQLKIIDSTLVENDDGVVLDGSYCAFDMKNSIVSDSMGQAVVDLASAGYYVTCSDFYNNDGGNWLGGPDSSKGQISDDPLYCDPAQEDYSLHSDSPCSLAACGYMGAYPIVCGSAADQDNDGMDDSWENEKFGDTSHTGLEDSDNDGLTDYEEFVYDSNPTSSDTDGDGMDDGYEAKYQLQILVNDAFLDADGDGACNLREFVGGTSPRSADEQPSPDIIRVSAAVAGNPKQIGTLAFPFASIQQGVDMAVSGDTVLVESGTYTGTGNRDLVIPGDKDLALQSGDGPATTIIDCEDGSRGISVNSGNASLLLSGFTIKNGLTNWGGGLYIRSRPGNVEIRNCRFVDNEGNLGGGAVGVYGTTAVFRDCTFSGSLAHKSGGAVHLELSDITFRNCNFENNYSALDGDGNFGFGGAVYAHQNSALHLAECSFTGNIADDSGGAVAVEDSTLTLWSTKFIDNGAGVNGGGLYADNADDGTLLANSFFFVNHAAVNGGGLFISNIDGLRMAHLTISRNEAVQNGDSADLLNCANAVLENSIVLERAAGDTFLLDGSDLQLNYTDSYLCDYVLTGGGGVSFGLGYQSVDPLLSWDGHLTESSPCRNAGTNAAIPADFADLDGDGDVAEPLPFDLDGSPRLQPATAAVDMGAFEYGRGLRAVYANAGVEVLEAPLNHGYSGICTNTDHNLYQGFCTPLSESPVDWAWGTDVDVSWSGCLYAPVTGTYTFSSNGWVDGIIHIEIDGQVVADLNTGGAGYGAQIALEGGKWVSITASFVANTGSNNMILGWTVPGEKWTVIPRKNLGTDGVCEELRQPTGFLPSIYMLLLNNQSPDS